MDIKTFLNHLNEEITCPICQEIFGEPKMLQPCTHTVCVKCLNKMANQAIQDRRNAIRCPMCNSGNIPIPQPEGNFNSLPNNCYIQRLKDMVTVRDAGTQEIMCGNCETKSTDSSYCFECCKFWCRKCDAAHKIVEEFREHRLLALKDFKDDDLWAMLQRPGFCQQQHHKNKLLEFYCTDCEKCLCQMCVELPQHNETHHIQPIKEVASAFGRTITKQIETLKGKIQLLLKNKETLQQKSKQVQNNSESAKRDVRNAVQKIIENLKQQERELVAEIDDTAERSQAHLKTLSDQITSHIEKLQRETETAEDIVQRKSPFQILSIKNDFDKRFNELNQAKAEISPEVVVQVTFIPSNALKSLKLGNIEKTVDNKGCTRKLKIEFGGNSAVRKRNVLSTSKVHDVSASASHSAVLNTKPKEFVPVKVIGKYGKRYGEFANPRSVAVNVELNELAVTDFDKKGVQIFDLDGNYLRQFGQEGSGPGMFKSPAGVVYDKQNNIVVSDSANHTVSVFTREGRFLRYLASEGFQIGQVRSPWNLSVTDEGNIIVADYGNKRIQVFTPDGRLVVKFGDTGNERLQTPTTCVYHRDHYIVTDYNGMCMKMYDRREQYVKTLILHQGNERKPITDIKPWGITSTNCGNIIATDVMSNRLVMFRLEGSVIATVGSKGSGLGQFSFPNDVSVLGDKKIIVCDHFNHRLQVLHHP